MSLPLHWLLTAPLLLCLVSLPAVAGDKKDELIPNPYYQFWAGSKVGSTAVHVEKTKLPGPDGKLVPDGVDEKRVAYKLVEVNSDRVVVEMVVTEREFLGFVESAPTKYIYPAKVKRGYLERFLQETGAKIGEEAVKLDGKDLKCQTVEGVIKGQDGEETVYKLWLSDTVAGTIVKKVQTTRQKGDVVAETTITLESHKKAN